MSLKLNAPGGGSVTLQEPTTASNVTLNLPASNGTVVFENSSGNVGIGTSSPAYGVHVSGSTNRAVFIENTSSGLNTFFGPSGAGVAQFGSTNSGVRFLSNNAEAVRIDSSGNVGIGTSSPGARLVVNGSTGMTVQNNADASNPRISLTPVSGGPQTITPYGDGDANEQQLAFCSGVIGAERARIDSSGNLLVGMTSTAGTGVAVFPDLDTGGSINVRKGAAASGARFVIFDRSGVQIGAIVQNGTTGVSYQTSSDYRLKENVQPMVGALAKVAALKPVTYKWKSDGSDGEGFIAHELQEVCPSAVSGEKDAVNADGNPVYQGIDTSFLVATLTAGLQEAVAMIEELKAKVAALEAK
jgi:hypothetical protein